MDEVDEVSEDMFCDTPMREKLVWEQATRCGCPYTYYSPSAKRLKRRSTIFSPVSAMTFFTRSPIITVSSFTQGCIINTCPLSSFLSLLLRTSSRLSCGTRAIEGSSRIVLRACSTTSAGTSSKLTYLGQHRRFVTRGRSPGGGRPRCEPQSRCCN